MACSRWREAVAVDKPGHGGHIERAGTDTTDALKEEPRGAGAFCFHHFADGSKMMATLR